jgi:hypothetical protein
MSGKAHLRVSQRAKPLTAPDDAWEYMDVSASLEERNLLGKVGWELAAVSFGDSYSKAVFHLKRKVKA